MRNIFVKIFFLALVSFVLVSGPAESATRYKKMKTLPKKPVQTVISAPDTETENPPASSPSLVKKAAQDADDAKQRSMSARLVTKDLTVRKRTLTLGKNDSFVEMLMRLGFNQRQVNSLGTRLARETGFVLTSARTGQKIVVTEKIESSRRKILAIEIPTDKFNITIDKNPNGYVEITKNIRDDAPDEGKTRYFYKTGIVNSTIAALGASLDIPSPVTSKAIRVLNGKVNASQIRKGDKLEVLYEYTYNKGGERTGVRLLYTSLLSRGVKTEAFRFSSDGKDSGEFYDPAGNSFTKSMLSAPLRGKHKITSGFGYRRHPILGRKMLHTGVDFRARRGEPIYAAGEGTIDKFGRYSGYGNFVRVKHDGTWSTAYAHMSAYAKGVYLWKRVKKGELLGYVGSTGRSTGPHLHFELQKFGTPVDPLKAKLPVGGKKLIAKELYNFKQEIKRISNLVSSNK